MSLEKAGCGKCTHAAFFLCAIAPVPAYRFIYNTLRSWGRSLQEGLQQMFKDKFYEEMCNKNLDPGTRNIKADGRFHRFSTNNRRSDKAGFYLYREFDGYAVGYFGDWRTGQKYNYFSSSPVEMPLEQRKSFKKRMDEFQKREKQAKNAARKKAAKKAENIWAKAKEADPDHPYLSKKGIKTRQVIRQIGNSLVFCVKNLRDELTSLQFIAQNGQKRFLRDGQTKGSVSVIKGKGDSVLICEGWATAASLNEATGYSVIIAFNATNMAEVVKKLKPNILRKLVICGDNDQWRQKPDGTPWNPGKEKALSAAWEKNVRVVIPNFKNTDSKPTDFNDLASQEGLTRSKNRLIPQSIQKKSARRMRR